MKKLIPIGISDFKDLIAGNYYYVDKTMLIKDLKASGQVVLATRPRRFGKTLNLSMLQYFFEKSEPSNVSLFEHTAIWNHAEYQKLQGQFFVIKEWEHDKDHVHCLIKKEFPGIRSQVWKEYFWSQSFCLITGGEAPLEVLKHSIQNQGRGSS